MGHSEADDLIRRDGFPFSVSGTESRALLYIFRFSSQSQIQVFKPEHQLCRSELPEHGTLLETHMHGDGIDYFPVLVGQLEKAAAGLLLLSSVSEEKSLLPGEEES